MTWEETIQYIRTQPEYKELVDKSYLAEDLGQNVKRYGSSDEFTYLHSIFSYYRISKDCNILEIGAGNGIASINFALLGYKVTSVEPDTSQTVGAGAIAKLKEEYRLNNLEVITSFGESLPFPDKSFDVVFVRQALHHANNLNQLMGEASRVLTHSGVFIAVREHIVFDTNDKAIFLETHPLQKFYGGENAFTLQEYCSAIKNSGLHTKKIIRFFDSVINYYPLVPADFQRLKQEKRKYIEARLNQKFGKLADFGILKALYGIYLYFIIGKTMNERNFPGRMYSFIATKP